MRRLLIFALKFFVTLFFLYVIVGEFHYGEMLDKMGSANLSLLFFACLFLTFQNFVSSKRFHSVFSLWNKKVIFSDVLGINFRAQFLNMVSPSFIVGDGLRLIFARKILGSNFVSFVTVGFDRVLGFLWLTPISLVGVLFYLNNSLSDSLTKLIIAFSLTGPIVFFSIIFLFASKKSQLFFRIPFMDSFLSVKKSLSSAENKTLIMLELCLLCLLSHTLTVVAVFLIAVSIGSVVGLAQFMVIVPPILILSTLPITLGGWGVREFGFAQAYLILGHSQFEAVIVSVLFAFIYTISNIPGLFLIWFHGFVNDKNS